MTYNVFGGTLNFAQSIVDPNRNVFLASDAGWQCAMAVVCMIREFPWVPWESHGNGKH